MSAVETDAIASLVANDEQAILTEWIDLQKKTGLLETGRINTSELAAQSRDFLRSFRSALAKGGVEVASSAYGPLRDFLGDLSRSRALQGFSPRETATFVFSLKQPLFNAINRGKTMSEVGLAQVVWAVTILLDELGLYTAETYQKSREEIIHRQQREIAELSTPVVKLWDGVLALPIIGTLDSQRTQVVMENLLQSIVDEGAAIAIIRPQIAQTIVHLGVELNVISKATLADAFAIALRRIGRTVVKIKGVDGDRSQRSDEKGE